MSNAELKNDLAHADLIRDLALAKEARKKRFDAIVRFVLSTPEQKCIGWPEQKCIMGPDAREDVLRARMADLLGRARAVKPGSRG